MSLGGNLLSSRWRASDGNLLTPEAVELIVAKLSKMRGAALKLGQMLSIQGTFSILILSRFHISSNC
jgi:hypothetical protein